MKTTVVQYLLLVSLISQTGYAERAGFDFAVWPFFPKYCARCHNAKKQELLDWEAIAAEQVVQVNLSWSPEWRTRQFRVSDVWIDEASRTAATQRRRRAHVRFQKHRWLAGWVDHDKQYGSIVALKDGASPAPGSSGIQIR
jgi:hypothetical protein